MDAQLAHFRDDVRTVLDHLRAIIGSFLLNHVEGFGLKNPSTCFRHGGGNGAHALLDPRGALGAPQARARSRVKYLSFHYTY